MSDTLERLRKVAPLPDHREFTTVRIDLLQAARAELESLQAELNAERISHPTDICDCRFDFGGGDMTIRRQCGYHKGIEAERDKLLGRLDIWTEDDGTKSDEIDRLSAAIQNIEFDNETLQAERSRMWEAQLRAEAERDRLIDQDEVHWKTRRTLLAERDRYAALLDEIVAFFDVLANKYRTEATDDDEWPTDWIARAKELRKP